MGYILSDGFALLCVVASAGVTFQRKNEKKHRKLFEMIEKLRVALVCKKSDEILTKVLRGLITYCMEHFESEELVWFFFIEELSLVLIQKLHKNQTDCVLSI